MAAGQSRIRFLAPKGMKPAEKLSDDITKLGEKLRLFFEDNGLSDADEFIDERLAMLTIPLDPPKDPEREKSEEL